MGAESVTYMISLEGPDFPEHVMPFLPKVIILGDSPICRDFAKGVAGTVSLPISSDFFLFSSDFFPFSSFFCSFHFSPPLVRNPEYGNM